MAEYSRLKSVIVTLSLLLGIWDVIPQSAHAANPIDCKDIAAAVGKVRKGGDAGGDGHLLSGKRTPFLRAAEQQAREMQTVAEAMDVISKTRNAGGTLTAEQQRLVAQAEKLVTGGTPVPAAYKPISRFGYRQRQTMLSLADVGDGHLNVTLQDKRNLDGLIVHHEYIDRETKAVAPYRMIDPALNAKVRLHAGTDAPVTVYFGRPNFQPNFATDKITPIHQTAAAATAVFKNGTADVKIAMDGMTTSEAMEFMQGVDKASVRKSDQYLTAAFNLNTKLIDDRPATLLANGGKPRVLTNPQDIAAVTADLVREGRWNKVAWDGADDKRIPSLNFIMLLGKYDDLVAKGMTPAEAQKVSLAAGTSKLTELVHDAHSKGLETYISAGMQDVHMANAANAGVDGVGMGFGMHFREPGSGVVGPLDPAKIQNALRVRNEAEATVRGQAIKTLAQLDSQFSQGKLKGADLQRREALYKAIMAGDESAMIQTGTVTYGGMSVPKVMPPKMDPRIKFVPREVSTPTDIAHYSKGELVGLDQIARENGIADPASIHGIDALSASSSADVQAMVTGRASMPGARGYYRGTDGLSQGPSPRERNFHAIRDVPRIVDPLIDGSIRAPKTRPYQMLANLPDGSLSPDQFYSMIEATVPKDILKKVDATIAEAERLAAQGLADTPPLDKVAWRRAIVQSYLHSRDLTTLMHSLGYEKNVTGIHDLNELVPARDVIRQLTTAVDAPEWFVNYVKTLKPDDKVNAGFFNPHISASFFKWGDAREGVQTAMDVHRLSDHHAGNSANDIDLIERGVNGTIHHTPREHMGVQHRPVSPWSDVSEALQHDPALKDSGVLQVIAKDVVNMGQILEREGHIIPWDKMKMPTGFSPSEMERSYLVVQDQRKLGVQIARRSLTAANAALASATPATQGQAKSLMAEIAALDGKTLPRLSGSQLTSATTAKTAALDLTRRVQAFQAAAALSGGKDAEAANAIAQALGAKYAALSITDSNAVTLFTTEMAKLGIAQSSFFEPEELQRAMEVVAQFRKQADVIDGQGDTALGGTIRRMAENYEKGFEWNMNFSSPTSTLVPKVKPTLVAPKPASVRAP